jgi:hypothetical protein
MLSIFLGVASVFKFALEGCEDLQFGDAGFFRDAIRGVTELLICSPADWCPFSVCPSLLGDNKHEFLDEPDGIGF